jgi:hypothetical protein
MGKAKNGILGAVSGKVNKLVWYTLNGEDVVRSAGRRSAKLSDAQLANCSKMSLIVDFFSSFKPFLKAGFSSAARGTNQNYYNLATSYNKLHAIKIVDGIPVVDYKSILLSRGNGLAPENPTVNPTDEGLEFQWDYKENQHWDSRADQVMMMAFFPEQNESVFVVNGAKRSAGNDILELHPVYRSQPMEIYMAFISDDRQDVSTSLYMGRIN